MRIKGIQTLDDRELPETARSIVFTEKGVATVRDVPTPLDILEYSMAHGGRWTAVLKPYIIAMCPSDQAGGNLDFPAGNTRTFDGYRAIPGHEIVSQLIGGSRGTLNYLALQGISLGDLVIGDINVGCDECKPCAREDPALYCANNLTFVGIGSSPHSPWIEEQVGPGRHDIPGGYTDGFMVMPARKIFKIPSAGIKSKDHLAVIGQADAYACSIGSCNVMHLATFAQERGFDDPSFLIAGSGRFGGWHIASIKQALPNAKIYTADVREGNLEKVGNLFGVPNSHRYLIIDTKDAYAPGKLDNAFGTHEFDFIVDTAGHGVFDGPAITSMMIKSLYKGGVFCTTSHIEIPDLAVGYGNQIVGSKSFVNSLSPKNNFPKAIKYLSENIEKYAPFMTEIPGGLDHPRLAANVATGGADFKNHMDGTTFYTSLVKPEELDRILAATYRA